MTNENITSFEEEEAGLSAEQTPAVEPTKKGARAIEEWRDAAVRAKKMYPGGFDAAAAYLIACAFHGWMPKGHTVSGKLMTRADYEAGIMAALSSPIGPQTVVRTPKSKRKE